MMVDEGEEVGESVVVRQHEADGDRADLVDAVLDLPHHAGIGHPREAVAEQFERRDGRSIGEVGRARPAPPYPQLKILGVIITFWNHP